MHSNSFLECWNMLFTSVNFLTNVHFNYFSRTSKSRVGTYYNQHDLKGQGDQTRAEEKDMGTAGIIFPRPPFPPTM